MLNWNRQGCGGFKKNKFKIYINVQGDEPTINPSDIKKIIEAKKKFPNHVICGYDKVHKFEDPSSINLPKVVVNEKQELIYISRALIPGSKKGKDYQYLKQVCIYAFNKKELQMFSFKNRKGQIESMEDIEILRFFDVGVKIKMIRLTSNSVAVDEKKDVIKAEKLLKLKKFLIKLMTKEKFLDPNIPNKSKTVEEKIQLFEYKNILLPLPTEIEILSQVRVTESVHFVQEVDLIF